MKITICFLLCSLLIIADEILGKHLIIVKYFMRVIITNFKNLTIFNLNNPKLVHMYIDAYRTLVEKVNNVLNKSSL